MKTPETILREMDMTIEQLLKKPRTVILAYGKKCMKEALTHAYMSTPEEIQQLLTRL
jgi:hypothetical protein